MTREQMIAAIDEEIQRLQQVRMLLEDAHRIPMLTGKLSKVAASAGRRTLSPEARKKIADAQKRRWAKQKKQPAAKG